MEKEVIIVHCTFKQKVNEFKLEFASALRCTFVSETQILLHVHYDDMCL